MSMKAKANVSESMNRQESGEGTEDAVVMVLFPKSTWDTVVMVSEKMGIGHGEVLSMAVENLVAEMERKDGY